MTNAPDDPVDILGILNDLGAVWSPDFDAYAAGTINISQVRCVLCKNGPCKCYRCPVKDASDTACGWTRQPGRACQACGAK